MKTKALTRNFSVVSVGTKDLLWTALLATLAVIAPALLAHTPHNQWITGTIINALLFVAAWRVGLANAILVAILPSSIALMRGLLPVPMAMLIPFIITSNVLLVVVFSFLKKKMALGVIAASLAKFLLLFSVSIYFAPKLFEPLVMMMQWSQLTTALAGGFVATAVISLLQKRSSRKY